jgi:cytidine deaminase
MKTVSFNDLPTEDQEMLRKAAGRLPRSLNKVTDPSTCAVALGQEGHYFGNNIFLSNDTLACAEATALAGANAAGDRMITKFTSRSVAQIPSQNLYPHAAIAASGSMIFRGLAAAQ